MSNAPFEEKLVTDIKTNKEASQAHDRLQKVLQELSPEKGIIDNAGGSGRHASNVDKKKGKAEE